MRSGKFKQGKTALKRKDEEGNITYCCLGVLGEISGLKEEYLLNQNDLEWLYLECDINTWLGCIEAAQAAPAGFKIKIGKKYKKVFSLAQANDQGATFKIIANFIEKNYKKL